MPNFSSQGLMLQTHNYLTAQWTKTRPQLYALLFNQKKEDVGDGAYGLSTLSEKTRISNNLPMSLQRQQPVGPVWGSNPRPPAR